MQCIVFVNDGHAFGAGTTELIATGVVGKGTAMPMRIGALGKLVIRVVRKGCRITIGVGFGEYITEYVIGLCANGFAIAGLANNGDGLPLHSLSKI